MSASIIVTDQLGHQWFADNATELVAPVHYKSSFNFSRIFPQIRHAEYENFNLVATEECTTTEWDPAVDPIELTIVSGSQYGQFVDYLGHPLGTSVSTKTVPLIYFKADGNQPSSSTGTVTVQASVNDVQPQTVSFQVLCNLQPQTYRQTDNRWDTVKYDHMKKSIGSKGCALTSLSMAMTSFGDTITPSELNSWMKENSGYSGSNVFWSAVEQRKPAKISVYYRRNMTFNSFAEGGTTPTTVSVLDNYLSNCKLVIVQIYNPTSHNQHWVLVTGKQNGEFNIIDPYYSDRTKLGIDEYKNRFWSFVVIGQK